MPELREQAPGTGATWLTEALWPGGEIVDARGRGASGVCTMVAVPHRAAPTQLIPRRPASLRAVFERHSDDRPLARAVRDVAGVAALVGLSLVDPRRRLSVRSGPDGALVDRLREQIDPSIRSAVVLCGPVRANRKPVLQLLDARGRTVAFVKVAWNAVTRALLDRESNALRHLASHADAMRIPDVLASGDEDGVAWLGLSPVAAFNRRRGDEATAFDVARTIELTAPAWTGDERTNPFLVRFQQDVTGAPRTSAAAAAYVDAVERGAGAPLLVAASHGDFVPWNLSTGRGLPAVWDWERYEQARPLGYDRFHYAFQCAIHRRGLAADVAVAELRGRAAAILPEVAPDDAGWYADWYLLDLICRYERDGEAVALDSLLARVDAIATVLERTRRAP